MKKQVAVIMSALLLGGGGYAGAAEKADKPKAYMVSNAHLDTQWNWDIQKTINDYVWNTINQNLFLIKQYPDYIFNFEGGVKYSWMKEYYPIQFEELRKVIKDGRWHISGSSWDATDALVPSVESAIRNIMLGQNFYRDEFGVESTDIFLPDCFGFGYTLPAIASHCGLLGFSSQKLQWRTHPFYGNEKYPFTIGLWKGIDGSKIMMYHGYDYNNHLKDEDLSESGYLMDLTKRSPLDMVVRYYGVGDIGGSPTMESVRAIEKGLNGNGPLQIVSAESDRIYKDFLPYDSHPELPEFEGELLMDVHGTGCYTSQAAMKLYNRQNELLGDAAERASVAADWLNQASYPGDLLTENWKRVIFHQFHDDLTGTSIPRAYEFSWNDELLALKQFSGVLTSAVNAVAREMDTRVKGTPVILYNALGFPVTDIAEVELDMPRAPKGIAVYDMNGNKVPSQFLSYSDGKARFLIEATVPAMGCAVYDVRAAGAAPKAVAQSDAKEMENSVYKITLDAKGDITSLYDKRNGKELVKPGKAIRLALFKENKSYEWPAWEVLKETVDREPVSIDEDVKITMVENGDLRKTLCVEKRCGDSLFKQYINLYEGDRADRIDFYNEIDWQLSNALLKAEFPLNIENEEATYDLGLGSVKRGNNKETAYEVYAQTWADLTDKSGNYGVSVMNDSKYGWDKPDNNTLRLTLLHTPETKNAYAYQNRQDFGHHTFTYSLVGHNGELDKPATVKKADLLNQKLKAFSTDKHKGVIGKEFSFASSDNPNVVIKALKKAEKSDEYVVRVYEIGGEKEQNAQLSFAGEIVSASEADGTEKTIGTASYSGNELAVNIKPYSVKTFKLRLKPSTTDAYELQYAVLPLSYNKKCSSFNEFRGEADFEGGYSYAAELLPETLTVNGIPFTLGEKDSYNGLTCNGEVIELPKDGKYNKLYVLAAATDGDYTAEFDCGGKMTEVVVPSYTGFIGQWGHQGHTDGYLKDADVAYVGTHRHSPSGDEAYEFTYMFKYGIDIPAGAQNVTLPKNDKIVLFAATAVQENDPVKPAAPLFRTANKDNNTAVNGDEVELENILKNARIIGYSGYLNENETPARLIDGDINTKWCETGIGLSYVDFDLGKPQAVKGWKLVNAGREDREYITSTCFLLGRNGADEEWHILDNVDGNRQDIMKRMINSPSEVRYVRLLVTRPMQQVEGRMVRINEMELY